MFDELKKMNDLYIRVINRNPELLKTILYFFRYHDKQYRIIAQVMGIPLSTCHWRIQKAAALYPEVAETMKRRKCRGKAPVSQDLLF